MKYLKSYNESLTGPLKATQSLENNQEITNIFNIARDEGLTVRFELNSYKNEEYYNVSRYLGGKKVATKEKLIEICQEMLDRIKYLEYDAKVTLYNLKLTGFSKLEKESDLSKASNLITVLFHID